MDTECLSVIYHVELRTMHKLAMSVRQVQVAQVIDRYAMFAHMIVGSSD